MTCVSGECEMGRCDPAGFLSDATPSVASLMDKHFLAARECGEFVELRSRAAAHVEHIGIDRRTVDQLDVPGAHPFLVGGREAIPAVALIVDAQDGAEPHDVAARSIGGRCGAHVQGVGFHDAIAHRGGKRGWRLATKLLTDERQKTVLRVLHGIAAEERGAGAGLGGAGAVGARPGVEIEPVMIDHTVGIHRNREAAADAGRHANDRRTVRWRHGVAARVEIADVLNADGVRVLPLDARRHQFERSAGHDGAVGEAGKVLPDVGPTIVGDMVVLHALLQFKVIRAAELPIAGRPGVVLLQREHGTTHALLREPVLEFLKAQQREAVTCLHGRGAGSGGGRRRRIGLRDRPIMLHACQPCPAADAGCWCARPSSLAWHTSWGHL